MGLPERVGGALVLDFVNTRDAWLNPARRVEHLPDPGALLAWTVAAGALPAGEAAAHRGDAALHGQALALRDTLFDVFSAAAHDRPLPRDDLNAALAALAARPRLRADGSWGWTPAPDRPLAPVLASAQALLAGDELDRLRQCPGPDGWCGWLFLDRSRNGSRRWCSMALCGNPAKARARAARRTRA
jgi:predicted RNA-binding Zn ribbon-like protein